MTSFRAALAAALLSIFLISCGETFRPIANPVPGPSPAPQAAKTALVVATDGVTTHFNLSGETVVGTTTVGPNPSFAIFAPNLGRVFISNAGNDTISFYTATTPQGANTTITLSPGANPQTIVSAAGLGRLYVSYPGRQSIGIVDALANRESGEIALPGTTSVAMIATADSRKVYSANANDTVSVIDTTSNAISKTLNFGGGCLAPSAFAQKPDGTYVYVVCKNSNKIFWINTSNDSITDVAAQTVGAGPTFVTYDANRNRIVVVNNVGSSISLVNENIATDPSTYHNVTTIPVGLQPVSATPLANGSKIYVANAGSTNVSVVDSSSLVVVATIPMSGTPTKIVSSSDSLRVAVALAGSLHNLSSIDTSLDQVVKAFPLTADPVSLLMLPI